MASSSRTLARWRAWRLAIVLGLSLVWITGLIPRWGQWYSEQPYYRAQVQAFLEGHLALSHQVEAVTHDLAWIDGGVQQVWGLGVPMWLTPFEVVGRIFHITPFPDRVAMMFGMVLALYALARAWFGPGGDRSYASIGAFLITALLPGVITMLRGRMAVYEEASAYAYGASMLVFAGLMMMIRRPSTNRYVLLCAFAGATGLLRPTVWFFGTIAVLLSTWLYVAHRGSLRRALRGIVVGASLYLVGGGALFFTNMVRFGKGGEFGHRLNLADLPGNTYATRFDYPFEHIPFGEGTREIVGGMFGRPERKASVGYKFYEQKLHTQQAPVARWREYYFTTYTWAYVPFLVGGVLLTFLAWARVRRRQPPEVVDPETPDLDRETRWLGAWALLSAAPLFVFYVRSPSVSSRYFLDLAPSIAILLTITWRTGVTALGQRAFLTAPLAFAVLAIYWTHSALGWTAKRPWMSPVRYRAAVSAVLERTHPDFTERPIPEVYDLEDPFVGEFVGGDQLECPCFLDIDDTKTCDHARWGPLADQHVVYNDTPHVLTTVIEHPEPVACISGGAPDELCSLDEPDPDAPDALAPQPTREVATRLVDPALYRNGTNWDLTTGVVGVATYFFVDDPDYVEVELSPALGPLDPDWVPQVRAKIQLEELPLLYMQSTARGVRVRFGTPKTAKYRKGIQIAFLAFGPPEELDRPMSHYKLWRMAWHDAREPRDDKY